MNSICENIDRSTTTLLLNTTCYSVADIRFIFIHASIVFISASMADSNFHFCCGCWFFIFRLSLSVKMPQTNECISTYYYVRDAHNKVIAAAVTATTVSLWWWRRQRSNAWNKKSKNVKSNIHKIQTSPTLPHLPICIFTYSLYIFNWH